MPDFLAKLNDKVKVIALFVKGRGFRFDFFFCPGIDYVAFAGGQIFSDIFFSDVAAFVDGFHFIVVRASVLVTDFDGRRFAGERNAFVVGEITASD